MVKSIVQVGNRMIVAGQFCTVKQCPPGRMKPCSPSVMVSVTRNNLFAFNATTGDLDAGFRPVVDSEVDTVIPSADNASLYIGGWFTNVNGVRSKSLERISVTTGASIAGFNAPALNGIVTDLKLSNGRLFLAGSFTVAAGIAHAGLATVNPSTGAVDPFVNLQVSGHHNFTPTNGAIEGAVGVWRFDIAPNGRRLVAVGNFTSVSGFSRDQIVMVDLTGTTARVTATGPRRRTPLTASPSGSTATCEASSSRPTAATSSSSPAAATSAVRSRHVTAPPDSRPPAPEPTWRPPGSTRRAPTRCSRWRSPAPPSTSGATSGG